MGKQAGEASEPLPCWVWLGCSYAIPLGTHLLYSHILGVVAFLLPLQGWEVPHHALLVSLNSAPLNSR